MAKEFWEDAPLAEPDNWWASAPLATEKPTAVTPEAQEDAPSNPMGSGFDEIVSVAKTPKRSVLEGVTIPEQPFNPAEGARLSRRVNNQPLRPSKPDQYLSASPEVQPRGVTGAIKDTALGLGQGAIGLVKGVADNFDAGNNAVSETLDQATQGLEFYKSDALRNEMVKRDSLINTALKNGGEVAAARAAFNSLFTAPGAASDVAARGVGSLIPTLGLGATGMGELSMMAVNALSNAGDAANQTADGLRKMTPMEWGQDPRYLELLRSGQTHEQAVDTLAPIYALPSQMLGGITGAVSGKFGAEQTFAGKAASNSVRARTGRALSEIGGEQLETLVPQVAGNLTQGAVDGKTNWDAGLGRAAVDTLAGTIGGAGIAALHSAPQKTASQHIADIQAAPDIDTAIASAVAAVEAPTRTITEIGREWQDMAPTAPADDLGMQRQLSEAEAGLDRRARIAEERARIESERLGGASARAKEAQIQDLGQQWQDLGISNPADDLQAQRAGMRPDFTEWQNAPLADNQPEANNGTSADVRPVAAGTSGSGMAESASSVETAVGSDGATGRAVEPRSDGNQPSSIPVRVASGGSSDAVAPSNVIDLTARIDAKVRDAAMEKAVRQELDSQLAELNQLGQQNRVVGSDLVRLEEITSTNDNGYNASRQLQQLLQTIRKRAAGNIQTETPNVQNRQTAANDAQTEAAPAQTPARGASELAATQELPGAGVAPVQPAGVKPVDQRLVPVSKRVATPSKSEQNSNDADTRITPTHSETTQDNAAEANSDDRRGAALRVQPAGPVVGEDRASGVPSSELGPERGPGLQGLGQSDSSAGASSAGSANSGLASPAPQGKEVSRYNGKFGKGMGKDAARLEAQRLNRANSQKGVVYTAEEHGDPKLENPYAVVGRKTEAKSAQSESRNPARQSPSALAVGEAQQTRPETAATAPTPAPSTQSRQDAETPRTVVEESSTSPDGTTKEVASQLDPITETKAPISDFGQKIGGAKKDTWTGFKDDLSAVADDEIAGRKLSEVWPAPDYQKMINDGMDSKSVAVIRALRDEIPAKPRNAYKLKRWAEQVKTMRDLAANILNENDTASAILTQMERGSSQMRGLAGRVDLYEAVGHGKSLEGIRLALHHYSLYRGRENVSLWVAERDAGATAFSNWPQELATGDTKEDAIAAFKARYAELDSIASAKKPSFDIITESGKKGFFIGKKIGRNIATLAGPFDTLKEARAYRDTNLDALDAKLAKYKEIPNERRDTNEPRVGEDMRNGQDVTPEMFAQSFGFKGVEFGNWVEQKRRQKDLNDAFDALMDMAAIMGVPAKAISLNGELGLAFGARGSGGVNPAAAHYEPGKVVINLTKREGAGSLGHEWWHALDNYFSRMRGSKTSPFMTTATDVGLSARGANYMPYEGVRKEMIDAFGEVVRAIKNTAVKARSSKMDAKRTKEYWTTGEEMSARAFESYLISKLHDQNASNDYLANVVDEKTWEAMAALGMENEGSYPYPTAGEMPVIRAGFDKFFQTLETKETDKGVAMFARGTKQAVTNPNDVVGNQGGRSADDTTPGTVKDIAAAWDALGIKNSIFEKNGTIELSRIEVPAKDRNSGIGTKAMQQLLDYADSTGQRITLTPSSDFGGSKSRLVDFYKGMGFKENKGRSRDFTTRDTMIRESKPNEPTAPDSGGATAWALGADALNFKPQPRQGMSTVESLQAAVTDLIGGKQLPNKLGRVVAATSGDIKATWEPLIGKQGLLQAEDPMGDALAFYDPTTKTVFLMADRIPSGDETAILVHELMHKHGQAALGKAGWDRLHGVIGTWAEAEPGSQERRVYDYAAEKVESAGQELSNQELFPYAVEGALKMGIKPSMAAKRGTVANWLESVRQHLKMVWDKITAKPGDFKAQDLVNLAFGIAQMENPESRAKIEGFSSEADAAPRGMVAPVSRSPAKTPMYEAMRQLSRFEDSFQTSTSTAKDLADIAEEMTSKAGYERLPFTVEKSSELHQGNRKPTLALKVTLENGNVIKLLDIFDADKDRPFVVIGNSEAGQKAGGATAYQIAFAWAHNNGKTMRPDPAGLTVINRLRRTEAMISSAMHFGTTKHLEPHQDQYVALLDRMRNGGKEPEDTHYSSRPDIHGELEALKAKLWTNGDDATTIATNVQHLLEASTQLAYAREPAIRNFEVVGGELRVRGGREGALSLSNSSLADTSGANKILGVVLRPATTGVGASTLRRAAVSGSVARASQQAQSADNVERQGGGNQRPDMAALQAIRQVLGQPNLSASDGLTGVFYSRGVVGQTSRQYTPEQLQAMKNVGFQVEAPTLQERLKAYWQDAGKKMAQGIVDQFAPIKELDKEAYGLMRLSKGASGAFEVFLNGGQLKLSDGVYDFDETKRGGVVEKLLIPLQGEHHDFMRWVAANRAERLQGEGKENLFTAQDIADLKTLADGKTDFDYTIKTGPKAGTVTRDRTLIYPDSLRVFNAFNKNVLDLAEQSGLIDGESRKTWEHEFYVPFYRVADEAEGGVRGMNVKGGAVRQQAFKVLKGGKNALNADLLDNTLMNWAHLLDAAAKNRAAKATIEAAERMGIAVGGNQSTLAQMGTTIHNKNGVVWFMDGGQKRYSLVDDPYVMAALTSLEYAGMRNPVMNAMSAMKHWLTIGVTASPFFKIRNLIRDSVQVVGTSPISANIAKNVGQGWALTDPKRDEYMRLMAGGGTIHFGTMLEGSEAKRVQALVESGVEDSTLLGDQTKMRAFYRKYVEPAVTAYNELGNRGEAINRASLYDQLVKQGVSHADASLQARDLMDFSMQGTFTTVRFLTQVVPFFNARIQGMYKLGRAAKEDPARFSAVIGAAALMSLALMAKYHDDDDWKKREDWDRNNYWWFKFGGKAFRIPKPFEIGAIATLAERGFERAFEKEMTGERFRKQVLALLADNLAMNPVPQMIKPIMDVYANKDSFSGNPIESMSMEKLKSEYRYTANTSMAARGASTALNAATGLIGAESLSPVQIDHMLRGYFGWLGSFVVGAGDLIARPATNQPSKPTADYWKVATGGIVQDVDRAASRYVSQIYDQAKEVEQAYGTFRALAKEGKTKEVEEFKAANIDKLRKHELIAAVKKAFSQINEQIRMIERSAKDPDTKQKLIQDLQDRKDQIARKATA